MCTLPSTWPSTSIGLIARPTSCTAITFSTAPVSRSAIANWAAKLKHEWMVGLVTFGSPSFWVQSTTYSAVWSTSGAHSAASATWQAFCTEPAVISVPREPVV